MRDRLIELLNHKQDYGVVFERSQMDERKVNVAEIANSTIADYLLANGVTINPYPLMFNQIVYVITEKQPCHACRFCSDFCHKQCPFEDRKELVIKNAQVCSVKFNKFGRNTMLLSFDTNERHFYYEDDLPLSEFGKTVFFTREEAEQAMKGGD